MLTNRAMPICSPSCMLMMQAHLLLQTLLSNGLDGVPSGCGSSALRFVAIVSWQASQCQYVPSSGRCRHMSMIMYWVAYHDLVTTWWT